MSTPVSPALVRDFMKDPVFYGPVLRDHIRATAAEIRHAAELVLRAGQLGAAKGAVDAAGVAKVLREFADKLEGIES